MDTQCESTSGFTLTVYPPCASFPPAPQLNKKTWNDAEAKRRKECPKNHGPNRRATHFNSKSSAWRHPGVNSNGSNGGGSSLKKIQRATSRRDGRIFAYECQISAKPAHRRLAQSKGFQKSVKPVRRHWRQYFVRFRRRSPAERTVPTAGTIQIPCRRTGSPIGTSANSFAHAGHRPANWQGTQWRNSYQGRKKINPSNATHPNPMPKSHVPNKLRGHSLIPRHIVAPTPGGHITSPGQTNKSRRPTSPPHPLQGKITHANGIVANSPMQPASWPLKQMTSTFPEIRTALNEPQALMSDEPVNTTNGSSQAAVAVPKLNLWRIPRRSEEPKGTASQQPRQAQSDDVTLPTRAPPIPTPPAHASPHAHYPPTLPIDATQPPFYGNCRAEVKSQKAQHQMIKYYL